MEIYQSRYHATCVLVDSNRDENIIGLVTSLQQKFRRFGDGSLQLEAGAVIFDGWYSRDRPERRAHTLVWFFDHRLFPVLLGCNDDITLAAIRLKAGLNNTQHAWLYVAAENNSMFTVWVWPKKSIWITFITSHFSQLKLSTSLLFVLVFLLCLNNNDEVFLLH